MDADHRMRKRRSGPERCSVLKEPERSDIKNASCVLVCITESSPPRPYREHSPLQ